jgi:hypothetical protein
LIELGLRLSQPKWRGSYPSGPASMPFILYHHKSKNDSISPCPRGVGLFYGALDPRASQKELKAFATPKGKRKFIKKILMYVIFNEYQSIRTGPDCETFP